MSSRSRWTSVPCRYVYGVVQHACSGRPAGNVASGLGCLTGRCGGHGGGGGREAERRAGGVVKGGRKLPGGSSLGAFRAVPGSSWIGARIDLANNVGMGSPLTHVAVVFDVPSSWRQDKLGTEQGGGEGDGVYASMDAFVHDMRLIFNNALLYNAKHKGGVFDCATALLRAFESDLKSAQKKLAAPPVSLKSRLLAMLNRICDHRMGGEQPSALFLQAVDEKVFITYRQFVKRPMDLGSIRVSRLVLF